MTSLPPHSHFVQSLRDAMEQNALTRLTLSLGTDPDLKRIDARPVLIQDKKHLSFTYHHAKRDITKNEPVNESVLLIEKMLGNAFRAAVLFTPDNELHLQFSRKGKPSLWLAKKSTVTATPPDGEHNREKKRLIDSTQPFLQALGVTDAAHQPLPTMSHKWKQINKFLEIFAHAVSTSELPQRPCIRITDFGSGKGYLTFAMHDYLRNTLGIEAHVTGVELRQDLVDFCNGVAQRLRCDGLSFKQGDVTHAAPEQMDALIALHACDTATDIAIHAGIRSGASVILCAPCCHKEIRPQLQFPAVLDPLLHFGIHQAQEADMITDSLRALLLEANGYKASVFEFISPEHTNKNKMIQAIRCTRPFPREEILEQIVALKSFYGIERQHLETLLRNNNNQTTG
ncbi:TPA: methyltransferase [Candidatus Sumerlaeota bacterium]|nr:methyltransferase [Candidatus Sumerlaeota bacterium]